MERGAVGAAHHKSPGGCAASANTARCIQVFGNTGEHASKYRQNHNCCCTKITGVKVHRQPGTWPSRPGVEGRRVRRREEARYADGRDGHVGPVPSPPVTRAPADAYLKTRNGKRRRPPRPQPSNFRRFEPRIGGFLRRNPSQPIRARRVQSKSHRRPVARFLGARPIGAMSGSLLNQLNEQLPHFCAPYHPLLHVVITPQSTHPSSLLMW